MQFSIWSIAKGESRFAEAREMGKRGTVGATLAGCAALERAGEWAIEIRVCGSIWNYSEAAAIGQVTKLREEMENRYAKTTL